MKRYFLLTGVIAVSGPLAMADTNLVSDDFESYADDNALYGVWQPRNGGGSAAPAFPDDGILTTDDTLFPDIAGNAVDHIGGSVMQHLTGLTPASPIIPSASQSIRYGGDIFVGNDGNSRMSIGLRNRTFNTEGAAGASNLLEMGTYNANGVDPVDGTTVVPTTTYAFRMILMEGIGDGIVQNPNWLYFPLDLALDVAGLPDGGGPDGIVNPIDIGAGWHTYSALITPDSVTVELDLYRDGLDNGATITAGSDVAGVDSTVTYNVLSGTRGFDSLRIGAASGISSTNGVAFDNVFLDLIDVAVGINGDYNDSGQVEQGDLDLVLQNWGVDTDVAGVPTGWTNDLPSGQIEQTELDGVLQNWGNTAAPDFSGSAVPEPTTLAVLGGLSLLALRRRA